MESRPSLSFVKRQIAIFITLTLMAGIVGGADPGLELSAIHTTVADWQAGDSDGGLIVTDNTGGELSLAPLLAKLGSSQILNTLPSRLYQQGMAATRGYLFIAGGKDTGIHQSAVYSAPIEEDGTIGAWQTLNPLPIPMAEHTVVASNGYLFVIGGYRTMPLDSVYMAEVNDDGTIGEWEASTSLPTPLRGHATVAGGGNLYVIGGRDGSGALRSTVHAASTNGNGTLGNWREETTLPGAVYQHAAVFTAGRIYVVGGSTGSGIADVYRAEVNEDGSLGNWESLEALPETRYSHTAVAAYGYLLVTGGFAGGAQDTIYGAPLKADGTLGSWRVLGSLPQALDYHTTVVASGHLFVAGGEDSSYIVQDTVYSMRLVGAGHIEGWGTTGSLPQPIQQHAATVVNDYIFVTGGYNTAALDTVYSAAILAAGEIITWTAQTAFPMPVYNHQTVAVNGHLFVIGGRTTTGLLSSIISAPINADGSLGAWTSIRPVPEPLEEFAALAVNGYLYVLGGKGGDGQPRDTAYSASIAHDGTIGTWSVLTELPEALFGLAAVASRGYIIVAGGDDGSGPQPVAYTTPLIGDGALGGWTGVAPLPQSLEHHSAVATDSSIIVTGGQSFAAQRQTYVAFVNNDSTISTWQPTTSSPQGLYHHATVVSGDSVFLLGGRGDVAQSTVYSASVYGAGLIGDWMADTSLPEPLSRHAAAGSEGYVFVGGGGYWEDTEGPAYSARITVNGDVGTWSAITPIPGGRPDCSMAVCNGHIFVVGGYGQWQGKTVYSAPVAAHGSIGEWSALTPLPQPLYAHASVVSRGHLLVLGGYSGGLSNIVFSAPINSDGSIGAWSAQTALPKYMEEHTAVVRGGYLIVLGGRVTHPYQDESTTVYIALINADGSIGDWTTLSPLPEPMREHVTVAQDGSVFVLGGEREGEGRPAVYSVPIWSSGTIGNWSTLTSLPIGLEEHAGVAANGHLLVLGGQDYNSGSIQSTVYSAPLLRSAYRGNLNHQFDLGAAHQLDTLAWTATATEGTTAKVRYRTAIYSDGVYGQWSPFIATAQIPLGTVARYLEYEISLEGDGQNATAVSGVVISYTLPTPWVSAVEPNMGADDVTTPITITGQGFMPEGLANVGATSCLNVTWIDTRTLTAIVPSGMATGTYTVTVTNQGEGSPTSAEPIAFAVTGPLERVEISPQQATLQPNETQQFSAQAYDVYGKTLPGLSYIWQVLDSEAGSVNDKGVFLAGTKAGVYTDALQVEVSYAGVTKRGRASIAIVPGPLDHVTVTPSLVTLDPGESQQFSAAGYDQYENEAYGLTYDWSVVAGGGVIDQSGVFTAGVKAGEYVNTVQASADGVTGNATVIVSSYSTYLPLVLKRWPLIPDAPTLYTISNPDSDGNYVVSWSSATFAETYELQEDDSSLFDSPVVRYTGASTSYNVANQPNGTWYYRVRACNGYGCSSWSNIQSAVVAAPVWMTIVEEGFEGTFPREGWDIEDLNPDSGRYYWGKRDCRARSGRYSAWCVGAGDSSISCGSNYRNDMFSWMVYGPFSLADASAAELVFDWTLETEYMYDSFWWVASTDGEYFYGYGATGGKGNWITGEKLDLSAVPTGSGSINMLGEDQVWIAFVFESDYVETDKGSFVDNVLLRKRVGAYGSIGEGVTSSPRVLQDDQDMRPIKLRRAQQE